MYCHCSISTLYYVRLLVFNCTNTTIICSSAKIKNNNWLNNIVMCELSIALCCPIYIANWNKKIMKLICNILRIRNIYISHRTCQICQQNYIRLIFDDSFWCEMSSLVFVWFVNILLYVAKLFLVSVNSPALLSHCYLFPVRFHVCIYYNDMCCHRPPAFHEHH